MLKIRQGKFRPRKRVAIRELWLEYERQKKSLSRYSDQNETKAREIAERLGL